MPNLGFPFDKSTELRAARDTGADPGDGRDELRAGVDAAALGISTRRPDPRDEVRRSVAAAAALARRP